MQLMTKRAAVQEGVTIAAVLGGVVLYALLFIDFSMVPFEDAAILMRYSKHVSQGYGIVWNVGEKPVEGATDFLFMVVSGMLVKCGFRVESAVRFLDFFSHFLTVLIVYFAVRRLQSGSRAEAGLSALCLGIGPGLRYTSAYFGTPFFALSVSVSWCAAYVLVGDIRRRRLKSILFALSALFMGLARPEGVFMAVFMAGFLIAATGVNRARMPLSCLLVAYLIIGGAYFIWRWRYFGHLLPNPFYRKGGGVLHVESLVFSVKNAVALTLPFCLFYLVCLMPRQKWLQVAALAVPFVCFVGLWVLLSNEMNHWRRFQYATMPLALLSWVPLKRVIKREGWCSTLSGKKGLLYSLSLALFAGTAICCQHYFNGEARYRRDGRCDVAALLSKYSGKGYTLATSEAGLLPLYSEWRSIDTWGLNDEWIAHNGLITEEYLAREQPELIVFHAFFSPQSPVKRHGGWHEMTRILNAYAQSHDYELAAVFGLSPDNVHYYYVLKGFADSAEIITGLRKMDYYWYETGTLARNYAD